MKLTKKQKAAIAKLDKQTLAMLERAVCPKVTRSTWKKVGKEKPWKGKP
jgi:hypothetical protein